MGFGDSNFLQKAVDTILGGNDNAPAETPDTSDSSGSGFSYVRELYWDLEDVDDVDDRQLYNLAYFGASTEERMTQFQADYSHALAEVHDNGSDNIPVADEDPSGSAGDADETFA